jgi:hypothetical protein
MTPDLTFVCCVEYGRLENQAILMIESLRRNGGAAANAQVIVVVGRRGAELRPSTLRAMEELDCKVIFDYRQNPAPWFNYANKVAAVVIANAVASTSTVCFLDSDIVISSEPSELFLRGDEDFAARCEYLPPAVHDGSMEHVPYWRRLSEILEVNFDDFPWLNCDPGPRRIRMYFNSGVLIWRRNTRFAETYRTAFSKLIQSRLAQHDGNFFTADQVILGPVILSLKLRWRHLSYRDHHMVFPGQIVGAEASPAMNESSLIHYSGSLSGAFREKLLLRLKKELPNIHEQIIENERRMSSKSTMAQVLTFHTLRVVRGFLWRLYSSRIARVTNGTVVSTPSEG